MNAAAPILVVDDDAVGCRMTAAVLERAGYAVEWTTDPSAALALVAQRPYALLVADVHMPEMRGTALAEQAVRVRPALPTLLITALVDARTRDEARVLGVQILTKPIAVEALLAAVGALTMVNGHELDEPEPDVDERPWATRGAAFGAGLGILLGALTVAGAWALYPPMPHHIWPLGMLSGVSLTLVLTLYVASMRYGTGVGDWVVLGYTAAVLVAASLVVTKETISFLRDHVPWGMV